MGHEIHTDVFRYDADKQKVTSILTRYANDNGDYKQDINIRWIDDKVYSSCDEAEEAIKKLDNGWYDNLAVVFEQDIPDNNSTLISLKCSVISSYKTAVRTKAPADVKAWQEARAKYLAYVKEHTRRLKFWLVKIEFHC